MPAPGGLAWASRARAVLEVALPTRSRGRAAARGFTRTELEAWLERALRLGGEEELERLRNRMSELAKPKHDGPAQLPDTRDAFAVVDAIIGTLLGTRDIPLSAPTARARVAGHPYDPDCIARLHELHAMLVATPLPRRPDSANAGRAARNVAFLDAYFSNYIEGTEFEIAEAREIVFEGKVMTQRPADAHDIRGTFDLVSDAAFMTTAAARWLAYANFERDLRSANRRVMIGRPEKRPGEIKDQTNQAGNTVFVAPELVLGTLREGYTLVRSLEAPFARAIALMFLITDVHPFADGNGRVARAFMNAELVSAGECRVLIPTVYRDDYVGALRLLTRQREPAVLVQALSYAQLVTAEIHYTELNDAIAQLTAWNAFDEANEGRRLRRPAAPH